MSRGLGFLIMAVGAVLLIMGIIASQKTGNQVMSEVTGHFTRETTWYLIGGVALLIVGGVASFRRK